MCYYNTSFNAQKCRNCILVEKLLFDTLFKGGGIFKEFLCKFNNECREQNLKNFKKTTTKKK